MTDPESGPGDTGRSADRAPQRSADDLIAVFARLVEPLGRSLPPASEVVLHDLARLPNSIVAVWGDVTGRRVGHPATDVLLEEASAGTFRDMIGYRTRLPDGRSMRSTTLIIRDEADAPVAALCINVDVSLWQSLEQLARSMTEPGGLDETSDADDRAGEVFARDVDELAAHLIHQAIREQHVPVELMKKEHKLAVVRSLRGRGMFMLRDAVEMIAASLHVTRFTIYNYLNELGDDAGPDTPGRPADREADQHAVRRARPRKEP